SGDWRLLFINRDRIAKVTPADVQQVAAKYLLRSNRTVGLFLPTTEPARARIPETPSVIDLVKDYKGGQSLVSGEAFDPTPENIDQRTKRLTLASGIRVALLPKKTRGETVVGQLVLHFGSEKSLQGATTSSRLLGPMLMRGTQKLTRKDIQDQLSKLGAKLNAGSDMGEVMFTWETKRDSLPAVLDLLKQVLRECVFPEQEFGVLKRDRKQRIEESAVDPESIAFRALIRKLHPYPKDDIRYQPTFEEALERLAKTTRADVVKLYEEQLGGTTGELALVGDFDADAATKQLEGILAGWKTKVAYQRIGQAAQPAVKGSRDSFLTPDKESATYAAGFTFTLKDTDPDYVPL